MGKVLEIKENPYKDKYKANKYETPQEVIDWIALLSQQEGLFDHEIANIINYDRTSVTRIRNDCKIPKRILENRKDKQTSCPSCMKTFLIRRKQGHGTLCDDCKAKMNSIAVRG